MIDIQPSIAKALPELAETVWGRELGQVRYCSPRVVPSLRMH